MRHMKSKRVIELMVLLAVIGLAFASVPAAQASDDNRAPALPSPLCDRVQAPAGNIVKFLAWLQASSRVRRGMTHGWLRTLVSLQVSATPA
jgi:hypothetical protein